jgi:hypothetical protein
MPDRIFDRRFTMAGKSNSLAEAILKLIFKGETDAEFAAGAGTLTTLYVGLHTADPTDGGSQSNNEVTLAQYPTYTRIGVARGAGFTDVTTSNGESSLRPAAAITFPVTDDAGTGCTITHLSIGTALTGAGRLLYSGTITPTMVLPPTTPGVMPQLTPATVIRES